MSNKTHQSNFWFTVLVTGAMIVILLSSCGSAKKAIQEPVAVVEYTNLSASVVRVLTKKLSPTAAVAKLKAQVFLGNPNLVDSQQPLVAEKKSEDKKTEVVEGKVVFTSREDTETLTFPVGIKGEIIAFDSTKMQLKVAFEEDNTTNFLIFGLNSDQNFTLFVKPATDGNGAAIKWGLKEFNLVSDPGEAELFISPETNPSGFSNNTIVTGRSVTTTDDLVKKKKKN